MEILDDNPEGESLDTPVKPGTIRVILADSQAIYRVGIRKVFALDAALRVGVDVRFSMRMPRAFLGSPQDVLVQCTGRVVRCSTSHNEHLAAATIDDYRFAEQ